MRRRYVPEARSAENHVRATCQNSHTELARTGCCTDSGRKSADADSLRMGLLYMLFGRIIVARNHERSARHHFEHSLPIGLRKHALKLSRASKLCLEFRVRALGR